MRSLKDLLKQVEKQTQVRRSGFEDVLAELMEHRDAASDPELRAALTHLCNALTRFSKSPSTARTREVLVAAAAAKRFPTAESRTGPRAGWIRWRRTRPDR